jgi:hypothetical protein
MKGPTVLEVEMWWIVAAVVLAALLVSLVLVLRRKGDERKRVNPDMQGGLNDARTKAEGHGSGYFI